MSGHVVHVGHGNLSAFVLRWIVYLAVFSVELYIAATFQGMSN